MPGISTNGKRLFIARHGETIFNKAARIQGDHVYTPLTRTGFAQADEMGRALARHFNGQTPIIDLVASDTDRAQQTISVIAEHIGVDWHSTISDSRLREIDMGEWGGAYYSKLGDALKIDEEQRLFRNQAPGGENYCDIADRLRSWLADQDFARDAVIISHGMTSRVLRGLLTGMENLADYGAPIATGLPQGSLVQIVDGAEEIIYLGGGEGEQA